VFVALVACLQQCLAFCLGIVEVAQQLFGVGVLEIVARILLFSLQEHIAIGDALIAIAAVEVEVVDVVDPLDVHGEALKPVGQLAGYRVAVDAADLLKICELRNFHAIAPHFPAQPPGAQRGAFPVVLDKADVVVFLVDANGIERAEIKVLQVVRRGLQDDLVLVVVLKPVRVLAVTAILGPARGLHIGCLPRVRANRAQRGGRMKRARPHFHVVGLQHNTAVASPVLVQGENQILKGGLRIEAGRGRHRLGHTLYMRFVLESARTYCACTQRSRKLKVWPETPREGGISLPGGRFRFSGPAAGGGP
jgi:hypothetical protein